MTDAPYRKPQYNIYSTMLIIAFVALLIGAVFAYLETMDYKTEKTRGAPPVSAMAAADVIFGVSGHCCYKNVF